MSENSASLFRGSLPRSYPFRYNGTFYWSEKEFREGSVFYNGKLYEGVFLNIDAYQGQLLVARESTGTPVAVFRNQVAWFTMGGRTFVNLRYLGYTEAEEGFFEVIRDGEIPLFSQVRKTLGSDSVNHNGGVIGYYDPEYDRSVFAFFKKVEKFYALENGKVVKVSRGNLRQRLRKDAGEPLLGSLDVAWHPAGEASVPGTFAAAALPGTGIGLPSGYFDEEKTDTVTVHYAGDAVTATYKNKIYPIGSSARAHSGKSSVSGIVLEYETGDPMIGVVVYDTKTSTYSRTDASGRYKIQLPLGENTLVFSYESKEQLELQIDVISDGNLDVVMTEKVTMLKGAVVSAESMANHRTTSMGIERIGAKTLGKIPTAFGEGDVLKAVLTLPGVKSVGEASSGFNVRGGSVDQNLILFNGSTIYNPTHMFGVFSSFNPDVVDNVELFKSSIPVEYGGRVSSVLNVKSKDGDFNNWKGSAGIGVLTSRVHIEGPLSKGKTSLIAGARTTYSDWILGMLPKDSEYAGGKAGFSDANIGLTHRFDAENTLQFSGYLARDKFAFGGDTTFNYSNYNASLAFRHKSRDGGSLNLSAGYDHFDNLVAVYSWPTGAYDISTYIRQAFLKGNRTRPLSDAHTLNYGANVIGYSLDPGIQRPYGASSTIRYRSLDREYALEPSVFASDNWSVTDRLSFEGGIRLSGFTALSPDSFYLGPEFRLSGKYAIRDNFSVKGGFNTMRQYIHLISNTSSISPMDTWKLSDADIKPTTGWQGAAGLYWTHLSTGIDLSAEVYYKRTSNHLDYKAGAVLSMNENLAEDLAPVFSRSYGLELMVKKTTGNLTGWLSYSYSRAMFREMEDRGNETIAFGNWYNAPYDKPHEVKLVGNYAFTHRYSLSVNVDYSTGRPVTIPVGTYLYGDAWRLAYSERNSYRIPDYFRTDVALNIDPGHSLLAFAHATFTLGVYNVTGRKNPYSVFFDTTSGGKVEGHMLSVFAVPVPYVNLNLLF
ncbi:MAG: carboxypeptidase-like regulatory domain-containing protein [Bacteroidales bacterium]|nr:carboxypeptidase-like regulatory domain-containing protein [Bacteroidales bacterium]